MSGSQSSLRAPSAGEWDAFVSASPQGTVFCRAAFLAALGVTYDTWCVEESGEPVLGAVILRNGSEVIAAPHEYTAYQGVLCAPNDSSVHRRARRELDLLAYLIEELSRRYDALSFCLHPALTDLRAFQWMHYHEPQLGQFQLELRYTGLLDLRACHDLDAYITTIRIARRQDYAKARAAGLIIERSDDVDLLSRLHEQTFTRQGIQRSEADAVLVRSIARAALTGNFGELLICRDSSGRALSASLFLHDQRSAYYLFGATDPAFRASGAATLLMLEQIKRCAARGLVTLDFVGINSPNRGDFKISFNAAPTPYFLATWKRPVAQQLRHMPVECAEAAP